MVKQYLLQYLKKMVMMKLRIMENDQGGNNDNNDNDKENEIIQMKY